MSLYRDALDALELRRYCCRRMILTHVDLIEKLYGIAIEILEIGAAGGVTALEWAVCRLVNVSGECVRSRTFILPSLLRSMSRHLRYAISVALPHHSSHIVYW